MDRRNFISALATLALASKMESLNELNKISHNFSATPTMPAFFIGHGSPMNGIETNPFTTTLNNLASKITTPNAILVISAHWLTKGVFVSTNPAPQAIYDFGGFPQELFNVKYAPKGSPEFATQLKDTVKTCVVMPHATMGLDHGAWTILKHIYPLANIPVFQMSIDYDKPAEWHFNLAKELAVLRKKGVVIIASGNIVHNLGIIDFNRDAKVLAWAEEFDALFKKNVLAADFKSLINYSNLGKSAALAIPTNDHYLPAIYALGLKEKDENLTWVYEGFQNASVSMRSFRLG